MTVLFILLGEGEVIWDVGKGVPGETNSVMMKERKGKCIS